MLLATVPAASTPSVVEMLDRYAAGQFATVVEELQALQTFDPILEQLRKDGPGWIAADPEDRERRELVAATFALEAARAGAWIEWKVIQKQPRMCNDSGTECIQPPSVLYWKAPPLLIEWGCELLRKEPTPRPVERWWHLAAVSVAQRSEDPQFLVGDPNIGAGLGTAEIGNTQDEIKHLAHARERFPQEARFLLAEGIARDRVWFDDAVQVYSALENHLDIGGEALMRFGALLMPRVRSNVMTRADTRRDRESPSLDQAIEKFERVESSTRDPYVVYLARYFKGRAFEQQGRDDRAEAAYRAAIATVPHAQSATIPLATLLFRKGRRADAHRLIAEMLAQDPQPADPGRTYVHADDRFWPQLIARLRAGIQQ